MKYAVQMQMAFPFSDLKLCQCFDCVVLVRLILGLCAIAEHILLSSKTSYTNPGIFAHRK